MASDMPKTDRCPIGPLALHAYNAERTECIWCGPNILGWQHGRWVETEEGYSAWTTWGPLTEAQIRVSGKVTEQVSCG